MIRYFAQHPTAANLLMVVLLAIGFLSLGRIRRETFPDYTANEVEIRVIYPGASAEEIETSICLPIEDAVDGVRFVHEVRSEARAGIGIVTVEMEDEGDIITFKDEIDTEVGAITEFPEEAEEPIISQLNTTDPVLTLLVAGPMSPSDLKTYCEQMKDRLQLLPEVSLVTLEGFADRQFRVAVSDEALRRYGISAADVADVLSRQNVDLPTGSLETADRDVILRFTDERATVGAIGDLILLGRQGGGEVRVRDVATVSETFELAEDKTLFNGQRAGTLVIMKTKNQDTIRVADVVKNFVEDERARQPQVDIGVSRDTSTLVKERLQLLINNGLQGMALVFFTMWLFFNIKLSFWVVMSLPVSFLGAFYFMPMLDLTINMLTMVGLLLALGILMDDGIVIAENIAAQRATGKSPLQAAIDGTSQVAGGVVSSFITTVCVLGPLATLQGDIGKVLKVVPIILILVLIISLVEAFLILPAHLSHSIGADPSKPANPVREQLDHALHFLRERIVGRFVDWAIAWRYLWLGSIVMILLFSVSLIAGGIVKFQAFPELDGDTATSRILLPPGEPLSQTEKVVDRVTGALDRVNETYRQAFPDDGDLVELVYVEFNKNADAFETGPHVATIVTDLLGADVRSWTMDEILQTWRDEVGPVPDAISVTFTEPSIGPAGRNIEVRMRGRDLEQLESASYALRDYLRQFVGVYNLATDLRRGQPEVRIRLQEGATGLGLDASMIARQLRTAFQGMTADEIQVGTESWEIDVQYSDAGRSSYADLTYFTITLPTGESVPLESVATVSEDRGWSRITRIDGQRIVTLRGDTDATQTNTNEVLQLLREEFVPDLPNAFPGVQVDFEGEAKEAATTQASMASGAAIGLLGVFVLLSFQFRNYVEPLMVIVAIPLAFIGVVVGHLLMGLDITMPSMLGFVSLAGIVVNDSILLVLFLKMRRQEGTGDASEAASQASRQRFRAVLITSATTIAGLMPLTLERSLQAQVLIPLVVSIVFGLMASTVLVLSVIPCVYVVLDDWGLAGRVDKDEE